MEENGRKSTCKKVISILIYKLYYMQNRVIFIRSTILVIVRSDKFNYGQKNV